MCTARVAILWGKNPIAAYKRSFWNTALSIGANLMKDDPTFMLIEWDENDDIHRIVMPSWHTEYSSRAKELKTVPTLGPKVVDLQRNFATYIAGIETKPTYVTNFIQGHTVAIMTIAPEVSPEPENRPMLSKTSTYGSNLKRTRPAIKQWVGKYKDGMRQKQLAPITTARFTNLFRTAVRNGKRDKLFDCLIEEGVERSEVQQCLARAQSRLTKKPAVNR
jgi:hypothetical protein